MPSWQSHMVNGLLHVTRRKRKFASAAAVRAFVQSSTLRPASYAPHPSCLKAANFDLQQVAGWPMYRTSPIDGRNANQHVLYLHGGAYIGEIVRPHWGMITRLTAKVPARCTVPIFPLAPHGTAAQIVPAVTSLLADIIDEAGAQNVTLIGDSAGGGMALAAAQHLRDTRGTQPRALVLISPWLDVSMTHPEQPRIDLKDPMLGVPGLAEAGRLYAGDLDVTDPFVSPLYGDIKGLAPMTVFTGSRDILITDSLALAEKAAQIKAPLQLYREEGLIHVYPLLPTPEGRAARHTIARIVAG